MAGVGTLVKQAEKMQRQLEALQVTLAARELEVTSGGGAVRVKLSAAGKFLALHLDPEFLREDARLVEETLLRAIQEAAAKAKEVGEAEMQRLTAGLQLPGGF